MPYQTTITCHTPLELYAKFKVFHQNNPDVYKQLVHLAHQAKNSGFQKYGINMLMEVVRWHTHIQTKNSEFKFPSYVAAYYARLIEHNNPSLKGFFRKKYLGGVDDYIAYNDDGEEIYRSNGVDWSEIRV